FHTDIKLWLRIALQNDILALESQQLRGRTGKASLDREKKIQKKKDRLAYLVTIKRFTYNPNADNRGLDSLNHTEVIKLGADFLTRKTLMKDILVNKFHILLIDESQDTNKLLMNAFLDVQTQHASRFVLGLFGDTMQRIYGDG